MTGSEHSPFNKVPASNSRLNVRIVPTLAYSFLYINTNVVFLVEFDENFKILNYV